MCSAAVRAALQRHGSGFRRCNMRNSISNAMITLTTALTMMAAVMSPVTPATAAQIHMGGFGGGGFHSGFGGGFHPGFGGGFHPGFRPGFVGFRPGFRPGFVPSRSPLLSSWFLQEWRLHQRLVGTSDRRGSRLGRRMLELSARLQLLGQLHRPSLCQRLFVAAKQRLRSSGPRLKASRIGFAIALEARRGSAVPIDSSTLSRRSVCVARLGRGSVLGGG